MLAVLFIEKVLEFVFLLVVVRKAVAGTDPHAPFAVGHHDTGYIVGDAVRVVLVVLINGECVSVVFVDAVVSGEPHIPELILRYGEYCALR